MSSTRSITCKELTEVLTDYLEGTMPSEDRAVLEAHLVLCEGCATYVEQMRQTIEATGTLTEEQIDPAAREKLLAVFREWNAAR